AFEPHAPLGELDMTLPALSQALVEVALDVVEPGERASEGVHLLRGRGALDTGSGERSDELPIASLLRVDGLADTRHRGFVRGFGIACRHDAALQPLERRSRLDRLTVDLSRFETDRLAMPMDPLVLANRLLDVLLAREPVGLARRDRPLQERQLRAER